ncbi:MAG: hypothetical protein LUG60_14710 [Erysipelotrichaceae bacterium]|nr:hypothetical protein [Erysipelotrichaceae bacterium]
MKDMDNLNSIDEISDFVHENKEPVFIIKDDDCEFVVMSYECYDDLMKVESIDQAIFESEMGILNGQEPMDAKKFFMI